MNSELPVSADALLAERARLEEELQSSEDWCELLRLKSRKDRGEGMSAVNAARLEMVLIDALAEDPNFVRYKAVCVALERLIRGLPPLQPTRSKPDIERDDLTQIRGITASMARRLNALDVTTFAQIADWRAADIQSISADLGIGKQIYAQNWIEQAAQLAKPEGSKPAASDAAPSVTPSNRDHPTSPPKSTVAPAKEHFVQPIKVAEPVTEKAPVHLSRVAAVQAILREVMPETAAEKPTEPEAAKLSPSANASAGKPTPAQAPSQAPSQALSQSTTQPRPPSGPTPAPSQQTSSKAAPASPTVGPSAKKDEPIPAAADSANKVMTPERIPTAADVQQQAEKPKTETVLALPAKPLPVPPAPLRPNKYGIALEQPVAAVRPVAAEVAPSASPAVLAQPARPSPTPPMPLRVQAAPAVADVTASVPASVTATDTSKPDASKPHQPASAVPAGVPPRPLVVTRDSLPPKQPQRPAAQTDAAPAIAASPSASSKSGAQPSTQQPTLAARVPQSQAAAAPASASVAPAMSIADAIAYAAEVARQGPRPPQTASSVPGRNPTEAAKPAAPPAVKVEPTLTAKHVTPSKPVASSAPPASSAKDLAKAPIVPPPLPAGFVPPEPTPVEPERPRVRSTTVHVPRATDRDDLAGYRLSAEEATVEIIVKLPSEPLPPRVALAKVSADTADAPPRAATPIGRFLKALTGN